MGTVKEDEFCFPHFPNTSCRKSTRHYAFNIFLYILQSCIFLLTVFLNLLVILSIFHFRQLQTPTNLLLLSLAVSDLLVGLLLIPVKLLLTEGCWFYGLTICAIFNFMSYILTSASVGNMVLISIDRYIAICHPLSYTMKVRPSRVQICICLCWTCSVLYNAVILRHYLKDPNSFKSCYGTCGIATDYITSAFDVNFTFLGPITVIIVLYMRVFVVAVSQARAMRSHVTAVTLQGRVPVRAKKSERKAATALGVVVVVFLICYFPYFYPSLAGQDFIPTVDFIIFGVWLVYCNSCINPLIYAYFYPWFRKSVKNIVTLQILQPGSRDANM